MRKWRFRACVLLALLALSFAAWIWWLFCGGISHREVVEAVRSALSAMAGVCAFVVFCYVMALPLRRDRSASASTSEPTPSRRGLPRWRRRPPQRTRSSTA